MPPTRARISTVSTASVCPTYSSKTVTGVAVSLMTDTSGGAGGGGALFWMQPQMLVRASNTKIKRCTEGLSLLECRICYCWLFAPLLLIVRYAQLAGNSASVAGAPSSRVGDLWTRQA